LMFEGDGNANMKGLCDYGTSATLPSGDWSASSSAQNVYEDCKAFAVSIEKQSGNWNARTLIVSDTCWQRMNEHFFTSSGPRRTVYDEVVAAGIFDNIYKTSYLTTGGSGGTTMNVMALDNSPENMAMVLPQDLDSLQPNDRGLYYEVPVYERIGELLLRWDSSYSEDTVDSIKYHDITT